MASVKQLYIDIEAVATLSMVQEKLLYPVTKLMSQEEMAQVDATKLYKDTTFPFSFILAPSGKRNEAVLKTLTQGEIVELVYQNKKVGELIMDQVFPIDKNKRVQLIYGTTDKEHIGVQDTYRRLGNYAICGEYTIDFDDIKQNKAKISHAIQTTKAKKITAIMLSAKAFHRVHERIVRTELATTDLLVLFVLKPYTNDVLPFDIRQKTIEYFVDHYLPKDKVIVLPLENTYIFGGFNELILSAIVAKNYGCNKFVVGQNHGGLGAYYEKSELRSILDSVRGLDLAVEIVGNFVYCDCCKTLVSTNACPHGRHHHVMYDTDTLLDMLKMGVVPPAILMRKEISAMILSRLFPERKNKIAKIHQSIFPSNGLLGDFKDEDFYTSLIELYQTSSLT